MKIKFLTLLCFLCFSLFSSVEVLADSSESGSIQVFNQSDFSIDILCGGPYVWHVRARDFSTIVLPSSEVCSFNVTADNQPIGNISSGLMIYNFQNQKFNFFLSLNNLYPGSDLTLLGQFNPNGVPGVPREQWALYQDPNKGNANYVNANRLPALPGGKNNVLITVFS